MCKDHWFKREHLPRAVIDYSGNIWTGDGGNKYENIELLTNLEPYKTAEDLERDFGPCVPLIEETEVITLPSSCVPVIFAGELVIFAGELKRALELRMGEHANRIKVDNRVNGGSYCSEAAIKAGMLGEIIQRIDPNKNSRWVLTPLSDDV